ncbi:BnaA09g39980D [Brassica napus]|uniref:BnaA09g39980D protein n=1 Tax=Brassica napus TaxID=3708 RepID=A0A078FEK6_BRANA|nr:BnaA09g39980D [Brassica napus]
MVVVESLGHGGEQETVDFSDDLGSGSACSTPFVSAPSSPGRDPPPGYFFSAPSSPIHFFLRSAAAASEKSKSKLDSSSPGDFEFDFSSRLSSSSGPLGGVPMTSAEELFSNGQIKPMKLSSHLQRPQEEGEAEGRRGRDLKLRSRSVHRKARSLSPLRNAAFQWNEEEEVVVVEESEVKECIRKLQEDYEDETKSSCNENVTSAETTPSCSASSSRSSSYGRNSKKWIFIKDLLHRSKSEGRGNGKEKFWSSISFSPSNFKDKKLKSEAENAATPAAGKPTNGIAKRRGSQPSAHELHYTTNRAQAEEMKKRTYLPYRHGLFGCLGFSSKGYSALNGLARSLNPVSSG